MGSTPPPKTSWTITRTPFYYGWMVLAVASFTMFMTMPGQTAGISVFLDFIIADLDVSRTHVSFLYAVATVIGASSLPFVGIAIDRFGPRRGAAAISIAFGLSCLGMALVVGPLSLLVGFTLIRWLGQGSLQLVSMHAVNQWFIRRRGFAVGVASLGIALGTVVFPPFIEFLLATLPSWREAYLVLGALVLLVLAPVAIVFLRSSPELFGLVPDGLARPGEESPDVLEVNVRPREAVGTMTFWLYTVGGFAISALGTGLMFHHYAIMSTNGLDRPAAAAMFVAFGLIMAVTTFVTGFLMDRMPPRYLLAIEQFLLAAALVGAAFISTPALVLVYGAVLGSSQGMHAALTSAVYAHYFGRRHYGAIKGIATTVSIGGTAFGPWVLAFGFEVSGSQAWTLAACAILPAVVAVTAPLLRLRLA